MNTVFTFNNAANVVDAANWAVTGRLISNCCRKVDAELVSGEVIMNCLTEEEIAANRSADADIAVTNGNAAFINELIRQVGHTRAGELLLG